MSVTAAVERYIGRGSHPALDLTVARVESLARDYPYFPASYDIRMDSESVDFRGALDHAQNGLSLDRTARMAWSLSGRPRESGGSTPDNLSTNVGLMSTASVK